MFFGDDSFQFMFVYQPTFNTLELKKDKDTNYVIGWKSESLQTCQLSRLSRETPASETLIYLSHDFQNLVKTPDFLNMHTKISKMTYN